VSTAPELWSVADVAAFLGAASPASARRTLGRWGVTATTYMPGPSGRIEARYDPAQVRQAAAHRPGRGARTDLRA
jgi:hypothetical protein